MNTFYIPNLQLFTCIIGGRYQCLHFIAHQTQEEALYLPELTQLGKWQPETLIQTSFAKAEAPDRCIPWSLE